MSEEGSEDSPPRPKRKIKKMLMFTSDSSSDSDESVTVTGTRRKRLRVLSDEGSDTSGSSVVCVGARRKRALPKLRDSEGDSDTSGWATDNSDTPKASTSASKPTSGFASDSSEGNSDKCSICLLRFTNQEVGTPQSCEHMFCLDCITEWSKNVNTCPVDRLTFDSIVVRTCAGGRVLRTEPVKVTERRPSMDFLVFEDLTVCEVCGSTEGEETMLLCDGCDLGYHMQCLTPPLSQVPIDQWLCPNCDNLLADVDYLFSGFRGLDLDIPLSSRSPPNRERRNVRSLRSQSAMMDEPSTSSGYRGNHLNTEDVPSTSRGSRMSHTGSTRTSTTRRKTTAHSNRRKPKRRRTKTVIIEYEVQENGKFPVTKRVQRKIKKRKVKRRQPRTAARRLHVRASVRAKLASVAAAAAAGPAASEPALTVRRQRAGIPVLNLFGDPNQIDYFSDDDDLGISESASTAVAARPTSNILSAYRQARRKMISIPSPTHASSAPDVLSSILESQTLLHSAKSIVSVSVDGSVNIKLETREKAKVPKKAIEEPNQQEKIDLSKGQDAAKKVPSYPGQSRGGRGWGGGYTGNYHREQGTNNLNNRGGNFENNYNSGGYQNRQGNVFHQNNSRREDIDTYNNYPRRPHQYSQGDDVNFDRNRRQLPENRGLNNQPQRHNEQGRYSMAPSWQPYVPPPVGPRNDPPHRHSFGGFENPLDMRMGPMRRQNSANSSLDPFSGTQAPQAEKPPAPPYRPLPEPPMFKFDKTSELDKSEDEKSDSSLVIDTEKYDPTEPTNDDDSGDEETASPAAVEVQEPALQSTLGAVDTAPLHVLDSAQLNVPPNVLDSTQLHVSSNVLDSAVRQVLHEHRELLAPPPRSAPGAPPSASDDDSDGDCPNFSIYSATSVHIANSTAELAGAAPSAPPPDSLEDLVQEDDDEPPAAPAPAPAPEHSYKNKSEEELKEKVSKRCPITTNPRNPIKIKLNTPSLIKRHVSLYDEEEQEIGDDEAMLEEREPAPIEPVNDKRSQKPDIATASHANQDNTIELGNDANLNDVEVPCEVEPEVLNSVNEEEKVRDTPRDIEEEQFIPPDKESSVVEEKLDDDETLEDVDRADTPPPRAHEPRSDDDNDELSATEDNDLPLADQSPAGTIDKNEELLEKMTESISETEDERSYTPCLDENKSKDTSMETEKDKGIEGLDTEMISEDEGNEMFSDNDRAHSSPSRTSRASPAKPNLDNEEGEIVDKKKQPRVDEAKKKKKKDSKKETKEKNKGKGKKGEVSFKKLSKSGKERNYRDKDKKRERRDSSSGSGERAKQRRKERRKDLERYDVRTLVSEKRRRPKDAFGRDVSPRASPSPRLTPARRDPSPRRRSSSCRPRRSTSRVHRSSSRVRRSSSRVRRSSSRVRRSSSRVRRSSSRARGTPLRARRSVSRGIARRASSSPRRLRPTPSPRSASPRAASPTRVPRRRRRSTERVKGIEPRRRRSIERTRKRRRSGSGSKSPRPKPTKRKKRVRSERSASRRRSPRRRSVRRRRARRRSASRTPEPSPAPEVGAAPGSVDSRLLSPRTPPPEPSPPPEEARRERRRRDPERARHRRLRDAAGPSKEVFTSGDNILVSVSFKEQERLEGDERRERRRERRRRRKRAAAPEPDAAAPRPVAIIDLERSPFRELTPSPRNVIVLSDSEPGEKDAERAAAAGGAVAAAAAEPAHAAVGPKTPPPPAAPEPSGAEEARGPNTPPEPPDSPDAYDPYEPTRSASASPGSAASAGAASPPRPMMTLETAQKTNMSADDVIDRRPLSPIEKVMALLQSTRDVSPEPPPGDAASSAPPAASPGAAPAGPGLAPAPAAPPPAPPAPPAAAAPPVRIVLPSPTRSQPPKLFLAKPSPIKSDPIKPMQAAKLPRAVGPSTAAVAARRRDGPESEADAESPYSPGSSDFGDLFEPPGGARGFDSLLERPQRARKRSAAAKVPVKLNRKKGKTQVGVKIDEDNLKILDDLPSSAVEMQVKSKFLKKLNRQERVVEEVKLVLKPHYNKKHVTKDEYKDILRRAVPKICHNKTGEINPAKIQALVEAYVKKFRKKHKLGLV